MPIIDLSNVSDPGEPRGFDHFVEKERGQQWAMDQWYQAQGYVVDRSVACKQFDLTLTQGDRRVTVEEKFRFADYGDCLLEIVQDLSYDANYCFQGLDAGWLYTCQATYLNYVVCDSQPRQVYVLERRRLLKDFLAWARKHRKVEAVICSEGYGVSLNIPYPMPDWVRKYDVPEMAKADSE